MQRSEFNNLMDGKAAKYANIEGLDQNGNIGLMGALMNAQQKNATSEKKKNKHGQK